MSRRKASPKEVSKKTTSTNEVIQMPIIEELKKNFILYAKEINKDRAFPYLLSGLKPIGAHALWSMWVNKRRYNKPYTKSAKIVGEVMSFSPHGDSYDSLVRLAQDFTYHCPYIDGHGSFGSVVGGPTAGASRYTEMRMSEFAQDVLFYNTDLLDMGLNYLEEEPEPILDTWVALLPLLYMQNSSGMGYTVSNTWSSGNLKEFRDILKKYLKTGKVDCSMAYPDFPTGGIIINQSEMKDLYKTGKGTIKLRGKVEVDGDVIKVLSLPYQCYPEQFIDDIKKYTNNNVHTITDFANRCDKNGFLIEITCEKGTAQYTLDALYKKTCLQISISDEHKAVTEEGKPELITLPNYIKDFTESNLELVIKEANFKLDKIDNRLEIVNGLLNALDIIDDIIKLIKKSKSMDDAKQTLMKSKIRRITFTENQADAIIHTPLGRLANLEQVKLNEEKDELEKDKKYYEGLRDDEKKRTKYFFDRFSKLVDKYGWDRKTELADIEEAKIEKPKQVRQKSVKEYIIALTETNSLKRIEVTKFRQTEEDEKSFKVQGNQKITMISNKGNMYKVMSNKIAICASSASGTDIVDIRPEIGEEKIINIYSEDVKLPYIYFVTKNGLGKMSKTSDVLGCSKQVGTTVCGLKEEGDEIFAIKLLQEKDKIEITTNQRTLTIDGDKPKGRSASGRRLFNMKKGEEIIDVHSI